MYNDKEPARYFDWMLWKLRQEKEQNMGTTFGIELYNDKEEPVQDKIDLKDYLEFVESVTSPESMNISSTKGRLDSLEYGKTPVNIASLLTGGMGLSSETGEFNEIIKKCLFQGKPLDDDTRYHLMRELGDIMWYWVTACRALNYNPNDVIKENIKKLQARYPDKKFDVEKSENRQEGDL